MLISTVTSAAPGANLKRIVAQTPDGGTETGVIGTRAADPATEAAPAPAEGPAKPGSFSQFMLGVGAAKATDQGVSLLIQQANQVTPAQIGSVLQQYNLVNSPELARSEGERLAGLMQGKESNALMLGLRAGVFSYIVLDVVAPAWSVQRKLILSALIAIAAAAALWFGIRDEPAKQPEPPAPQAQPAKS